MKPDSPTDKNDCPEKCQRFHVTLGWELIFAATVVFGLATFYLLSYPPQKSEENHNYVNPNSFEKSIERSANVCRSKEDSSTCPVCCESNTDYQEENSWSVSNDFYKDKRDLNAQEGVWRASNVMAFSSYAMVVLTIIGVCILVITMKATQKTLDAALKATKAANRTAEAAESAERAYVFLDCRTKLSSKNADARIKVKFRFVNHGKTPAEFFSYKIGYDKDNILRNDCVHHLRAYGDGEYGRSNQVEDCQFLPDSSLAGQIRTNGGNDVIGAGSSVNLKPPYEFPAINNNEEGFVSPSRAVFYTEFTYKDNIFNKPVTKINKITIAVIQYDDWDGIGESDVLEMDSTIGVTTEDVTSEYKTRDNKKDT